jgi:hypothetical protein
LITEGKYSAWFKTPVGEGAGVVELSPDGQLLGGDPMFSYIGTWEQTGERFKAEFLAKRTAPGPPGVFGIDEIDVLLTGHSNDGPTVSCAGFAKQTPGLRLEVTLVRMTTD